MNLPFSADQVVVGILGLGMLANALLGRKSDNGKCVEFERINMKLDAILRRLQ